MKRRGTERNAGEPLFEGGGFFSPVQGRLSNGPTSRAGVGQGSARATLRLTRAVRGVLRREWRRAGYRGTGWPVDLDGSEPWGPERWTERVFPEHQMKRRDDDDSKGVF